MVIYIILYMMLFIKRTRVAKLEEAKRIVRQLDAITQQVNVDV